MCVIPLRVTRFFYKKPREEGPVNILLCDTIDVEEEVDDDHLPLDDERYRDTNHNLVGLQISAFYPDEGGWFDGTITWYNTQMGRLRVQYIDGTDDYIPPEDINGVDVILKT